jgi:hypothetical protein
VAKDRVDLSADVVALMPCLYTDVPSTMSLAIWSITFRQNRWLTLEDTPIGRDFTSGRWVTKIR